MCVAIVEVKYKTNNPPREKIEFTDEAALEARLETLKTNDQVEKIKVYRVAEIFTKQIIWERTCPP